MAATRSKLRRIGIRERLGQLTFRGACQVLADGTDASEGEARLRRGQKYEINIARDVYLGGDTFRVTVPDHELPSGRAIVTVVEMTARLKGLHVRCDSCETHCDHQGAVLSLVLEDKLTLGLSAVPDPDDPLESLTEDELLRRALGERQQRADAEKMQLRSLDTQTPWTDYTVTSHVSGKTYRVSLRGTEPGESYCSCPDFRTNHLGTCKHILHALGKIAKRFAKKELDRPYRRRNLSLRLDYSGELGLRFNLPEKLADSTAKVLGPLAGQSSDDVQAILRAVRTLERQGEPVHIYPDAEEFIEHRLLQDRLRATAAEIRATPAKHPLRKELLRVELLPYQLDGIAFAVGAGRAVLADDMGLGKTIQGIGVAELLARQVDIRRVLIVCPASVKSQWRSEILKFSHRSCQIVLGTAKERVSQYEGDTFFTICNYEQIRRDHPTIERLAWDLIILDEGQRIKNWESKTSRLIKTLRSKFALVLSGTPLENRLEELYTVVSFIDDRRLGPVYRFFHRHRVVDDGGRLLGYKNLGQLRESLAPILLRRTRQSVMQQLPERTTEVVRIAPTEEQKLMSDEYVAKAAMIAAKKYISEMDLLRLQKYLLMARLAANSTQLVDKEKPGYSSKLERIRELLEQLAAESDRKILIFSEWTKMLDLIEPHLRETGLEFVRLDGSLPQRKRQEVIHRFQTDPGCRAIILSNAGATGLNLQAGNTVINVDLPWNPAVLEQRIGRAHRMGQKRPVQVYVLVTEATIEERLLHLLSAKHDLAMAALDTESDVNQVDLSTGIDELKKRLEKLLGKPSVGPVIDVSQQRAVEAETAAIVNRRNRVASAGGELLGAAINLVGQLLDTGTQPDAELVQQVRSGLDQCVDRDESGRLQLRFSLPDEKVLQGLAETLAKLLIKPPAAVARDSNPEQPG